MNFRITNSGLFRIDFERSFSRPSLRRIFLIDNPKSLVVTAIFKMRNQNIYKNSFENKFQEAQLLYFEKEDLSINGLWQNTYKDQYFIKEEHL